MRAGHWVLASSQTIPAHAMEILQTNVDLGMRVGLGLTIVRTCVEACGGTVSCRNRQPSGLEVTLRFNAQQQQKESKQDR